MVERYSESQLLRPMFQTVASLIHPGAGAVAAGLDVAVVQYADQIKAERLEYLINCLEQGDPDLGEIGPVQLSEPVIHAAHATIEATLRTTRREKIAAFARLFKLGILRHPRIDLTAEHEDYLKILDDLSLREIQLLYILSKFESEQFVQPDKSQDTFQAIKVYWDDFKNEAVSSLQIPKAEIDGLLTRLSRSGLYEPIYVSGFGGPIFNAGKLTGTFQRLEEMMGTDSALFDTGHVVP